MGLLPINLTGCLYNVAVKQTGGEMGSKRSYPAEFRCEVRDFVMRNPTMSIAQIARDFEVPVATVHGWMRGRGIKMAPASLIPRPRAPILFRQESA